MKQSRIVSALLLSSLSAAFVVTILVRSAEASCVIWDGVEYFSPPYEPPTTSCLFHVNYNYNRCLDTGNYAPGQNECPDPETREECCWAIADADAQNCF